MTNADLRARLARWQRDSMADGWRTLLEGDPGGAAAATYDRCTSIFLLEWLAMASGIEPERVSIIGRAARKHLARSTQADAFREHFPADYVLTGF